MTTTHPHSTVQSLMDWRELLNEKDQINADLKRVNLQIAEFEHWARMHCEETGTDIIRSPGAGLTVTVRDALRVAYDPDRYDEIMLSLVGVDQLKAVDAAGKILRLSDKEKPPKNLAERVTALVRSCLTPGDMYLSGRGFVSSRVEKLSTDGGELPDGLRLDGYTKVGITRTER